MPRLVFALLLIGPLASCTHRISDRGVTVTRKNAAQRTRIVLLGTGTPNADPDRSGPGVAIVVDGTCYLVDCGPGIVRRAAAAHRAGVAGLAVENLKRLFLTHLHSDHTVGLPDLILTPWVLERDEPLTLYGPVGSRAMTEHILSAYAEDIRVRLAGLQPANAVGYQVDVHEIEPGTIYRDEKVTVRAFAVSHGAWPRAFGFRFETPDRTIVISGDTTPSPSLVENAKDCDVLIHEVYSQAGFEQRPPEWQRYHAGSHTSTVELADIAASIKPDLLILYHQLFWGSTEQELLDEIRRTYTGNVVCGQDLAVY